MLAGKARRHAVRSSDGHTRAMHDLHDECVCCCKNSDLAMLRRNKFVDIDAVQHNNAACCDAATTSFKTILLLSVSPNEKD